MGRLRRVCSKTIEEMNELTRRDFLIAGSMAAAGSKMGFPSPPAAALDPSKLAPFVDPLPIPRIAKPLGTRAHPDDPKQQIPYYRIGLRATQQRVHRDLPATPMWGFDGSFPGPTIETASGAPMIVEWANELPQRHFLPIDHTLHGAEAS